jgi:hypothetical protein
MVVIFGKARRAEGSYRVCKPFGKERLLVPLLAVMAAAEACSSDTVIEDNAADAGILPDGGATADAGAAPSGDASPRPDGSTTTAVSPLRASATTVDFGAVDCGAEAAPKTVTITNTGARAVTWSAALQRSAPFTIRGPRGGVLAAGAAAQLTVAFDAPTGLRSGTGITDALVLDDGDDATADAQVTVRGELAGADLAFTTATLDFGSVDVNGPAASRPVPLENRGNRPATVTFDQLASGPFTIALGAAGAPSVVLAPNAPPTGIVARFAPDADGLASTSFTLVATGSVCTEPASSLDLTGTGVSSDLRVSEPELDWGLVNCGATGAPKSLALSNSGTAGVSYTLALAKGAASPFTLSRTSGALAVGATQSVTVTPRAIPAPGAAPTSAPIDTASDAFGDVLRITEARGAVRTVALLQTAKGAVFQALPASVPFPSTAVGSSRDYSVNLINVGSARARVQYTLTPLTGPFRSSRALGPVPVEGQNDSLVDTITFEPTRAGTFSATLTWSFVPAPGEVLCGPMPPAIPITGTATP